MQPKESQEVKKYRVYFVQTETFFVDVEAQDEQEASDKATEELDNGGGREVGDCKMDLDRVEEEIPY
jgi:hypothetical protein